MTISVIVCAFNEAGYLAACLHSLLAQSRRPDELLVVNNASTDDTALVARGIGSAYDLTVAPLTQLLVYRLLCIGTLFYGGNFAVRREALDAIGGFDTAIEFHGEDTNLGRRLVRVGKVSMAPECWLYTSARRYRAMEKRRVIRLYVRNFWSELVHHRPRDRQHVDVRI
jgi:glycosyltransferase involved in cell wall biosynthesis